MDSQGRDSFNRGSASEFGGSDLLSGIPKKPQFPSNIVVNFPVLVESFMNSYMQYKVDYTIGEVAKSVHRRFSDFDALRTRLTEMLPGINIFPLHEKKNIVG